MLKAFFTENPRAAIAFSGGTDSAFLLSQAARYARDVGACVIAVTDAETSPLAKVADLSLYAKSDMVSFVDSLVAPLSLLNALLVAVGSQTREDVSETFSELERVWDEYGVYEKHEG